MGLGIGCRSKNCQLKDRGSNPRRSTTGKIKGPHKEGLLSETVLILRIVEYIISDCAENFNKRL